jgi:hypothetical protein
MIRGSVLIYFRVEEHLKLISSIFFRLKSSNRALNTLWLGDNADIDDVGLASFSKMLEGDIESPLPGMGRYFNILHLYRSILSVFKYT